LLVIPTVSHARIPQEHAVNAILATQFPQMESTVLLKLAILTQQALLVWFVTLNAFHALRPQETVVNAMLVLQLLGVE